MPYFYFVPGFGAGFMVYEDKRLPWCYFSLVLDFPLTGDFTIAFSGDYFMLSDTENDSPLADSLLLDPFFENEGITRSVDLGLSVNKNFVKHRGYLSLYLNLFKKDFFEVENIRRNDSGFFGSLEYTKITSKNTSFFVRVSSQVNNSTIENLNYIKNDIGVGIQLIF
jgi:hypothetical protein